MDWLFTSKVVFIVIGYAFLLWCAVRLARYASEQEKVDK